MARVDHSETEEKTDFLSSKDNEVRQGRGPVPDDITAVKAALEAVLFAIGDSVGLDTLSYALCLKKEDVREAIAQMMNEYEKKGRGIHIVRLEDRYQLATKKEMYPVIERIVRNEEKFTLSGVLLETLSIIAYKQPVTRAEIEKIRGVRCDHAINRLIEFNIVKEVGRLDAPGRPILFGTTEEFLRHFGTDSLKDLPSVSQEKIEDFIKEARDEEETKLKV